MIDLLVPLIWFPPLPLAPVFWVALQLSDTRVRPVKPSIKMAKRIIYSDKAPMPIGPYSQAVLVNDTLYVSGQIALEIAGKGDISAETHAILQNIGHILKAAGLNYSHVVKSSIFLKDMNDFGKVNEAYGTYFSENPPARETVQVARLPKDVNVEISVVAVK